MYFWILAAILLQVLGSDSVEAYFIFFIEILV
jgi:hypothetical protein